MPTLEHKLHRAAVLLNRGLLDQAAEVYLAILAQFPEQLHSLHGLGIIRLQQGHLREALALLGQAATLQPQAAAIHTHLGDAYRMLSQWDQAENCYRRALQLQPDEVAVMDQLGLVLFHQGKAAAAVEQFRESLRRQPDRAGIHNCLGAALQVAGDGQQALSHFRRAVELDPGLGEAHSNLGLQFLDAKLSEQALFHCREAARLLPHVAEVHNNLGTVQRSLGRFTEARASFTEALRLAPHLALTHDNLGRVLQDERCFTEAVAWYRQALQLAPHHPTFRIHLVEALTELEQFEEARQQCRAVLTLDPQSGEAHNALGLLDIAQGRFEQAARDFGIAATLKPEWDTVHANLGNVLQEFGEFDASLASRRTAMQLNPRNASVLAQIATMLRHRLPDAELRHLRKLLDTPDLRDEERSALYFGLAQVHDARGDFAAAAGDLEWANAFKETALQKQGGKYHPAEHAGAVRALIQAFSADYFARVQGFGLETETPVFIVGLPRSGTTLVEQVLASHPRVFGAGELMLAARSFNALPPALHSDEPAPACLARLDRATVQTLAERHLAGLCERAPEGVDRIIDKLPANYLLLGWIATLFPRARLIHCRRDLRDVALSCWMTNFAWVPWASHPVSLVERIVEYRQIMAHWRGVLPLPILDVTYEDLVGNLEGTARRLVAFCGLEWEPRCLEFYRTRRAVATASTMQVRQPIYTSSIGRWRHYQSLIPALFTRLHELLTRSRLGGGQPGSGPLAFPGTLAFPTSDSSWS